MTAVKSSSCLVSIAYYSLALDGFQLPVWSGDLRCLDNLSLFSMVDDRPNKVKSTSHPIPQYLERYLEADEETFSPCKAT